MKTFVTHRRRKLLRWFIPALLAIGLLAIGNLAFAAHDSGLFELDTRTGVDGDQDKKNEDDSR